MAQPKRRWINKNSYKEINMEARKQSSWMLTLSNSMMQYREYAQAVDITMELKLYLIKVMQSNYTT